MSVIVRSNGNYSATLQFPVHTEPSIVEGIDVCLQIPFTQRDLQSLTENTSKRNNGLSISQQSNRDVHIHYKKARFTLSQNQWKNFLRFSHDLADNYNAVQPYYHQFLHKAGKDLCMLKHLAISLARFNSCIITFMYQRHLCKKHENSWTNRHVTSCTTDSTNTWCHEVAAIALETINKATISKILKYNKLGPLSLSMDQIIGTDFDQMVDKVHYQACYLFTDALVHKASHLLPQYREYIKNDYLVDYCLLCHDDSH